MTKAYDTKAYNKGWAASLRAVDTDRVISNAERRGEPSEWFDGWADAENGRDKYTLRDNPNKDFF